MSHPLAALLLCIALSLTACGSAEGTDSESTGAAADATGPATLESDQPEPGTFFVLADTDSINAVASEVQRAGAKARSAKSMKACNLAGDRSYQAWRTCWHALLDPLEVALTELASEFGTLTQREFPAECVGAMTSAQETYGGFASDVGRLLVGIDSDNRPAQVKALKVYGTTLEAIAAGFDAPFQATTQVCYSPADLASINASPSPDPE